MKKTEKEKHACACKALTFCSAAFPELRSSIRHEKRFLSRYNFERFCNGLQRVKRLLNFREPIVEGYFPKLDSLVSSRNWPARPSNIKLSFYSCGFMRSSWNQTVGDDLLYDTQSTPFA
ncbi:Phenoloxidase 1 [Frankliniella fusca]|uniref:Phenoloxidase 1 n=1 Tax=Frankliniella fusca TaxID=407009 RepID=A0AAE1HBB1_9NEOP|nr:Phenoloxidase 1 [Frankliniella fusca]